MKSRFLTRLIYGGGQLLQMIGISPIPRTWLDAANWNDSQAWSDNQ